MRTNSSTILFLFRNRKIFRCCLLAYLFLLTIHTVTGQDSIKVKKLMILPVPAFGYSPETKTYLGAVTLFTINMYRDSATRTSNAKFEVNYTWNKPEVINW